MAESVTYALTASSSMEVVKMARAYSGPSAPIEDDTLLEDVRRVEAELERPPTRSEYDRLGDYSVGTFYHRFGRWADVLRAAEIEPPIELIQASNRGGNKSSYGLEDLSPEDLGLSPVDVLADGGVEDAR